MWVTPPKKKVFGRMLLSELQTYILTRSANQIWVDVERYGEEGIVISDAIAGLVADSAGQIDKSTDLDGYLQVIDKNYPSGDIVTLSNTPIDSSDALITTTYDIEILTIIASANMDSGVANRTPRVALEDVPPVPVAAAGRSMESTPVTLSADQHGSMFFPPQSYHFVNDNGTVTVQPDENVLPCIITSGSTIAFENSAANSETGDRYGIIAKGRRVA